MKKRNLLFVLHGDFASNSAHHVHALANEACRSGAWDVAVAIDGDLATFGALPDPLYRPCDHAGALAGARFANGGSPDLIHAWTPREKIRRVCESLRGPGGVAPGARLVVHLEDNEELLLQAALGRSIGELRALDDARLDALVPGHHSHPHRYPRFLATSDGVTLLIDRLGDFAPPGWPRCVFWPAADPALFFPRPVDDEARRTLGIPPDHAVLVYTGNVHVANRREVRSLYLAVAVLNREGCPTVLVRTGTDHAPFLGEDRRWCGEHVITLGQVPRARLPELLALADVLVQPGEADAFNEYRFPSKLPEFFASGRPVVLPATNIGRHTEHGRHAYVLPKADALGIAGAVADIVADAGLRARLTAGGLEFAAEHFSWRKSGDKVLAFYENLCARPAADH